MSMEFVKAHKNFEKFMEERDNTNNKAPERSGGLLSPRGGMRNRMPQSESGVSELDKVAGYVQQIRKHRMKLNNGD